MFIGAQSDAVARGDFLMEPRMPQYQDFIDYAEGVTLRDADLQRKVLQMLAVSSELRQQMTVLKRDLYLINSQIPDFECEAAFNEELRLVAQSWIKMSLSRQFSFPKFLDAKEFFAVVSILIAAGLVLVFFLLNAKV
jgi:hypothetical protein